MSPRALPAFLPLLLAACQSAPPPTGPSTLDPAANSLWETALLRQAVCAPPEAPGTTELAARLAALTERLDELLARMPPTSPAAAPHDATATRHADAPSPANDAEIAFLTQGLAIVDHQRELAIEAIANVNTAGYKRRAATISTQRHAASGLQVPVVAQEFSVCTTGALEITERQLDVAIDGEGWFVLLAENGERIYTRDGSFLVGPDGALSSGSGSRLSPRVTVPEDCLEIAISPTGEVIGRTAGQPDAARTLGTLELADFRNPGALTPVSGGYQPTTTSGEARLGRPGSAGFGTLKQGFVERSNVQIVNELVNLQVLGRQRTVLCRALADRGIYLR